MQPSKIRFLDLSVDGVHRREYLNVIDGILQSGLIVNGPAVEQFEKDIAAYTGAPYAVGVGSGTGALFLALKCLNLGANDEVIVPALSFVGTANAIIAVGARTVFVDICRDLLMDPNAIESAITPRTRAIMPVHFTGRICDMDRICEIAARHNLLVIEDAAPAFGATYKGKKAGTFGPLGCFSMNPMKVLGGLGEAGAVVGVSTEHQTRLIELRYHGMRDKDICVERSLNERIDTIQAAILSLRMQHLEQALVRRATLAERYSSRLCSVVEVPVSAHTNRSAWYHYAVLCERRDELRSELERQNIETRVYHSRLMPDQPAYSGHRNTFPVGREVVSKILCLPMYERLKDSEVDRICDAVLSFYGKSC
jgi:dTDP-4-amino-4,6-dideoxygalactose transaminase